MYNPYTNYLVSNATQFGLAEAWAGVANLSASQPSMNVWAGNRFYRRHDINIDDFFMYNMSGGGGGVEDIKTPIGRFALAGNRDRVAERIQRYPAARSSEQSRFQQIEL